MQPSQRKTPPRGVGRNRRNTGARLWFAMLLANILGIFGAVMIAKAVRGWTLPPQRESIYLGVYYALMFIAALADAFWADEFFFKGAFRKHYLGGKTLRTSERAGDLESVAAAMKPTHIIFPLLVVAGLGVSYGLFNVINRGFSSDYERIGQHAKIVRTTHPTEQSARQDALDALSMIQRPQVQLFLVRQLKHEDETTAAWAAWAMGRIRDNNMRRLLADELMDAVRSDRPKLAREAALSLARMQHQAVASTIEKELTAELLSESIDPRLVWAMAYLQSPSSTELLEKALYHPSLQIQRLAAWALAQQRTQQRANDAYRLLSERLPSASIELRCAIIHAFGILGHEAANDDIIQAWKRSSEEERQSYCAPEKLPLRPDGKGNDIHTIFVTPIKNTIETFEVLSLFSMGAIRATTPELRRRVETWLESLLTRGQAPIRTKDAARSLLAGIRESGPLPPAAKGAPNTDTEREAAGTATKTVPTEENVHNGPSDAEGPSDDAPNGPADESERKLRVPSESH